MDDMTRRKPAPVYPVKSLTEANEALKEIANLSRGINVIETHMNEDIDSIKAQAAEETAPLKARMAALENGLMFFSEAQKEDLFREKRSVELDYGSLGYRRSTALTTAKGTTWKQVLGKLEELQFTEAIRIKREPDKDVLAKWAPERLNLIGVVTVNKDTFWYELNQEKLADLEGVLK